MTRGVAKETASYTVRLKAVPTLETVFQVPRSRSEQGRGLRRTVLKHVPFNGDIHYDGIQFFDEVYEIRTTSSVSLVFLGSCVCREHGRVAREGNQNQQNR